jgi:hypothetical protein
MHAWGLVTHFFGVLSANHWSQARKRGKEGGCDASLPRAVACTSE